MDNNIELMIIMPSYNKGEYIAEAIESVLMQKVSFKYKLVIAEDGSTDDTLKIVEKYRLNNPGIIEVLPSEQNQGLLLNCMRIYENMKTKYFCVCDADDYWIDDNFLQKAYVFLEENPEYTIYGSNSKILKEGIFQDELYHSNCEKEMAVKSIDELYNGKWKYVTNTLETVFRNVIFSNGIPKIMKTSVGTLSESSFRGDTDRYVMHLKYGYAKFVDETVGVYRQTDKGMWSSATDFHRELLLSRAMIDYNHFYDGINKEKFYEFSYKYLMRAVGSLFSMLLYRDCRIEPNDMDMENLKELVEELKIQAVGEYGYDNKLIEVMKNKENRKIVVWGTGAASQRLIEKYFAMRDILFYVDGNERKQGTYISNIEVLSPNQLKDIKERKYVIIASSFYNEIIGDILQQNLCKEDEIINLYKMDYKYSLFFE